MAIVAVRPGASCCPGATIASTSDIARGTSRYGTLRPMLWLSDAEVGVNVISPAASRYERAVAFDEPAVAAGTFSVTSTTAAACAGTVTDVLPRSTECGEPC